MGKKEIVPSAESLESFERIVARRREKREAKRAKPLYRKILESHVHEYRALKFLLHFPFGLIVGYVFFKISVDRLDFGPELAIQIAIAFIIGFSGCFALFVTFRCLACLMFPYLFGETGRLYIYTVCMGLIIAGPVANLVLNVGEVLRSIGCHFEVFVNLTKSRLGIRLVPLLDALMDIMGNQLDLGKMAQELIDSFVPIRLEVFANETEIRDIAAEIEENERDLELESRIKEIETRYRMTGQETRLKRMQKEYTKKLEIKCEDLLSKGISGCIMSFQKALKKCLDALQLIGYLLCWPLRLSHFCNLFRTLPGKFGIACDSLRYVADGFVTTIDAADGLTKNLEEHFEANMQYEAEDMSDQDVEKGLSEGVGFITQSVLWQYNVKKSIFNIIFQIIRRLLVLIFIFLMYRAQNYLNQYLTIIDFDNRYITSYFKHIDERRREQVKRTLLPLKKLELKEISHTVSCTLTDEEKFEMVKAVARALIIISFVLVIQLFDYMLAEIMDFITSIARMDFIQTGRHHVALNITGTGIMARMLRTIFAGFNRTHIIDNTVSNSYCLPKPNRTPWSETLTLYLCIAAVFASAVFEAPIMRTRRLICDFFYRKREKTRVLFLYNDMLRRRIGFLHEARHRVRKRCKKNTFHMPLSFLTSLRYQFPGYFEWLPKIGLGRQRCLICNDPESGAFIHCPTFQCKATYCRQCWIDVHAKCYACRDDDDWTIVSSGGGSKVALKHGRETW